MNRTLNRIVRVLFLLTVAALLPLSLTRGAQETTRGWASLEYLIGDWVGEGGGQPGQGAGEFSFHPDLQKRILVRKNYAAYPATKDRPAFTHDDLTVIYRESDNAPLKAVYFDSEGHVIHYSVTASSDQKTIEFVSDVLPSSPRFRLTYVMTGSDTVTIKFEIAPPGKPDSFSTYIEAKAKRK
jgi:hypothetical protein